MKIYRPSLYKKTIRITFSKKNDAVIDKSAVTVVEATKQEIIDTIKEVYEEELAVRDSNPRDFVKLTVQILFDEGGKRKKDEFSFRLYRCEVNVIQKLIDNIDSQ